jgi:multicomponent Na+:H+ antiporter subunit A
MVAAGVLVLGRVHPLLALDGAVLDLLLLVGFASIAIGGLLALAADELKQILAHSTISQYGYVVVLYGIGGPESAAAAALYVIAHGLAKSALFMTAGAVTEATGENRLSHLGGLARDVPVLAAASGVAAASLAALPLTLGFFKDELFFTAAWSAGPALGGLAVISAALTFAYLGRFWMGVFAGPRRTTAQGIPSTLVIPIVLLALISLAGGIVVEPFARLAGAAATATAGQPVTVEPAYHLDARVENVMAVAAWLLGAGILLAGSWLRRLAASLTRVGDRIGPRRVYAAVLVGLDRLSDAAHRAEVRDLRTSLLAVLVPTGVLTALGFAATPTQDAYRSGPIVAGDLPLIVLLALAVIAASTAARDRGRLRPVLALSVLGFSLAGLYAVMGAPDVALVAVVIETVLTLVFVAVFTRLPGTTVGRLQRASAASHRVRDVIVATVAGVSAFAVIWAALSRPPLGSSDAAEHIALTPDAHGGDVVTVILADFRGLDTMVEITVLAVAILGIATLLRRTSRP